jgi:hypothetical protein
MRIVQQQVGQQRQRQRVPVSEFEHVGMVALGQPA